MRLGSNTTLHGHTPRIHSTTHPCLWCKIICSHALRLHSWHVKHWPGHRSVHPYMSTWHASCISRRYLVHIIKWLARTHKNKDWHATLAILSICQQVIFLTVLNLLKACPPTTKLITTSLIVEKHNYVQVFIQMWLSLTQRNKVLNTNYQLQMNWKMIIKTNQLNLNLLKPMKLVYNMSQCTTS